MLITTLVVSFCKDGRSSVNVKLWFLVVYVLCEVLCRSVVLDDVFLLILIVVILLQHPAHIQLPYLSVHNILGIEIPLYTAFHSTAIFDIVPPAATVALYRPWTLFVVSYL